MSNDALSTANYAAVINDLLAKREEIDRTIALLRALGKASVPDEAPAPTRKLKLPPELVGVETGEASACMLRERAVPMTNREIVDELTALGYKKAKKTDNVNSALRYRADHEKDVVREGKYWRHVGKAAVVVAMPQPAAAPPPQPKPQLVQPQPAQPAAAPAKPTAAPAPQKGTPSSANGVSALR
jgi:hypothetical protein